MFLSRKQKIKYTLVSLMLLSMALVVALVLWPMYDVSKREWPDIENKETLVNDCIVLSQNPKGEIPRNQWPESVNDLEPVSVYNSNEYVEITISGGGINASWGYWIATTSQHKSDTHDRLTKTSYENIYRFVNKH